MVDCLYSDSYASTYFLYNEKKEALIVDPGSNKNNRLINHISKLGLSIKAILITHGHYDHIEALEDISNAFKEAKVYISEDEVDFLSEPHYNLSFFGINEGHKPIEFVPKNLITLSDNETFEECGFSIQMMKTPFHTKGSACYYIAKEKILFSGDTLFKSSIGRSDLPTGSVRQIDESLLKLAKLEDDIKVYPGHGDITSMGREKKYNMYLNKLSK